MVSVDTDCNKAKICKNLKHKYGQKCVIHEIKEGGNKLSEIQLCGKGGSRRRAVPVVTQ